jgi:hypothetical protein
MAPHKKKKAQPKDRACCFHAGSGSEPNKVEFYAKARLSWQALLFGLELFYQQEFLRLNKHTTLAAVACRYDPVKIDTR